MQFREDESRAGPSILNSLTHSIPCRLSQNEFAKELYQAGIFRPDMADQVLAVLDMMEFEGKQKVVEKVQQGQTMYRAAGAEGSCNDRRRLVRPARRNRDAGAAGTAASGRALRQCRRHRRAGIRKSRQPCAGRETAAAGTEQSGLKTDSEGDGKALRRAGRRA